LRNIPAIPLPLNIFMKVVFEKVVEEWGQSGAFGTALVLIDDCIHNKYAGNFYT